MITTTKDVTQLTDAVPRTNGSITLASAGDSVNRSGATGSLKNNGANYVARHPEHGPLKFLSAGFVKGANPSPQDVLESLKMPDAGCSQKEHVANLPNGIHQQHAQERQPTPAKATGHSPQRTAAPSEGAPDDKTQAKVEKDCPPRGNPTGQHESAVAVRAALAKLMELSKCVEGGDQSAQSQIIEILDNSPVLWQEFGDLSAAAERALVKAAFGGNNAMTAMLMRFRDDMKLQLLGDRPSLLVKLAVQRVVSISMFSQYLDMRCAEIAGRGGQLGELGRLQAQADQRFHRALRSLELVRKSDVLNGRNSLLGGWTAETAIAEKATSAQPAPSELAQNKPNTKRKKSTVTHRKPVAACAAAIHCDSTAKPIRQGPPLTTKGAERIAPYLPSRNGSRQNGQAKQLS